MAGHQRWHDVQTITVGSGVCVIQADQISNEMRSLSGTHRGRRKDRKRYAR